MAGFLLCRTRSHPELFRVSGVYLTWANSVFLSFFAFNAINNLCAFNVAFSSIPTAPTSFLILSEGLGNSARQQKAAISRETSAVEVTLRGTDSKPTISLSSRWNKHSHDIYVYEQGNNSGQQCMDGSGAKNHKSKMEFHRELKLASRVCRVGAAEKRRRLYADEVLEISSIENIECINSKFQPWPAAFATSFTQVGEAAACMPSSRPCPAVFTFVFRKPNPF